MHIRIRSLLFPCLLSIGLLAACGGGGSPPPMDGGELAAPSLDAFASPTNQNPITLTGAGELGATIQVRGGAEPIASADVAADGTFSVDVMLNADSINTLLVSQVLDGIESPATTLSIEHDGTPPTTPTLDPVTSPTWRATQTLRGSAEPGATLSVTGGAADGSTTVDGAGHFELEITLNTAVASITENDLSLIATDAAGNASEAAMAVIVHNPTIALEAPVLDSQPSPTSADPIHVTGSAEPGVSISVAGGAAPVTGVAGADGSFDLTVGLHHNAENTLTAFAVVPATGGSSAPATLVIIHDDIAPDAPSLDAVASPTGADSAHLTGTTEALARIHITGGMAAVDATADDAGAFAADVPLTSDSDNMLEVVASDAAGNASDATVLTVTQDSSLPTPISVDPFVSPTADNPITLQGTTEAGAAVSIAGGASPVMATAGGDGRFSASVTLNANARNELHLTRAASTVETIVTIVHDDIAPAAPDLNPLASPTNQTAQTISGTSEPNARIAVSGATSAAAGTADDAGAFSIPVTIAEDSTTTLSVIATDRAGNASAPSTMNVTHSSSTPDAPVVDAPTPPPTNMATFTVSGHITTPTAGVTITIRGGAADAMGPTDASTGVFSVDVTLQANMDNSLEVVSIDGAIESPAALVAITHDDIAPGAPDSAHISLGSTTLSTCLERTERINVTGGSAAVEGAARVRVLNVTEGSTTANATAGADGSFSTSITACRGDVLRITATDAAGNASDPTEMPVG